MLKLKNDILRYKEYVFLAISSCCFFLLYFILDFNGLYGQDSYEYLRFANRLRGFIQNGTHPGDYHWPIYYPFAGAVLSFITNNSILALQLISFLSFVILFFILRAFINELYPDGGFRKDIYLFLFLFLSPYMFRASFFVMSEMMSIMFIAGVFYFQHKYIKYDRYKDLILFACCVALSVLTRYSAIAIVLLPVIALSVHCVKSKKKYMLLVFFAVLCLLLIPHILIKLNNIDQPFSHSLFQAWSVDNFFKDHFVNSDGNLDYTFINLAYILFVWIHPGYIIAGIILLFFVRREDLKSKEILLMFSSAALYLLFLAGIPFQNNRFLILVFPLVLIILYPAFVRMTEWLQNKKINLSRLVIFIGVVQIIFIGRSFKQFLYFNRVEKDIVAKVANHKPSRLVYNLGMDGPLRTYAGVQRTESIWGTKFSSVEKNSLLLINPLNIESQWVGLDPEFNWKFIKNKYVLKKLETLPDGWELYEIQ